VVNVDPTTIPVTWANNQTPPGIGSLNLASTFPPGYMVYYTVGYELSGTIYWDTGDAYFQESTVSFTDKKTVVPGTILRPNIKETGVLRYHWAYGSENQPLYVVPNGVVPSRITFTFGRTGIKYQPYAVTWNIHYIVNVVRDCSISNITAPICVEMCQADPKLCYVDYNQYCLQGSPDLIAKEPCKSYLSQFIDINGSTADIDRQALAYCSSRYDGFADLLESSPKIPDEDRIADITICACHLKAKDVDDPQGTVLYDRYFNNLVAKFPAFAAYGASIQRKCLLPQCASSNFRPLGVPVTGCTVPQCFNLISIDNNGTINGNINTTASCQSQFNGSGNAPSDSSFTIIVIIIVVILIIFIIVLYFYGRNTLRSPAPSGGSSTLLGSGL
jgi:hypothetical protein